MLSTVKYRKDECLVLQLVTQIPWFFFLFFIKLSSQALSGAPHLSGNLLLHFQFPIPWNSFCFCMVPCHSSDVTLNVFLKTCH